MRRFAFLLSLVVTAAIIPGKPAKAQGATTAAAAPVGVVTASMQAIQITAVPGSRHNAGRAVGMAAGWLLIVALVGFVLLAFGADKLQIVVGTMQNGIGKSLGAGLLGQLAILPGAAAVVLLLAATFIGILLIPLGLVAFMLAVAGIAMFGFIAVAIMTGAAITGGSHDETANGAMLRAFFAGTAVYLGMWILVAALSGIPLLGAMLGSFAAAITFVAVTTGFGAVLLAYWRGEFRQAQSGDVPNA